MDLVQRVFTFLTFFVCCGCLAFLTVSLATQEWISAKPFMLVYVTNDSIPQSENEGKFRGEVTFGLFHGKKVLNYGLGPRHSTFSLKEEMTKNPTLMIFALWLVTVLGISLAIIFGLVSCIFAVINSVMTPVETVTGRVGLYLWNGVGALFCLTAIIAWVVQFYLKLQRNVMTVEEQQDRWTSDGRASLGYSFYFLVVALGLFCVNICILAITSLQPWEWKKPKRIAPKNPEGVIMLY
ncbi:clarin-3-like [Ornithodoros turicata]|uniref:Putative conserved plasma membrane protein n=1 Tax=Ornithodoros turicata TaxID=34597 RepID=A0A2R5LGS7_9ACAR